MAALALARWSVWSYGSDTGTFAQTIANTFHGFTNHVEGGTHFRFHFSPLIAVLWPIVAITRSPLSLQLVQVVLIALTALPLAALVRAYAPDPWPTRCAVLALVYPPLLANAFSEFHELAFYPALALLLIWAADRARWGWFALSAFALVLIREDASLDLAIAGIVLCIIGVLRRNTRERGLLLGEPAEPERLFVAGAALAVLAAGSLAVYAFAILPRLGPWMPSHFYDYPFAQGPLQTALALFTHPLQLTQAIATRGRLTYLLEAFVPLAFLPFFTRWAWLALPAFCGILLASDESVWRMGMHYVLLWAPWLVLAASWVLVKMVRSRSEAAATRWWGAALVLCAVFLIAFNPMHPAHYLKAEPFAHTADVQRVLRCIPTDAPVAMHDEWFAHEALAYPNAAEFGDAPELFEGYLLYASDWQGTAFERVRPKIEAARSAGEFVDVCTSGTVAVLRANSYDAGK
jgi:uncharacterized membrane protein